MPQRRPNLFIVGAPRCGTTSLHAFLSTHPDVYMSPAKEPHYFSTDLTEEADRFHGDRRFGVFRTLEQYLWLFREAQGQRVVGEASPLYLFSKAAAREIAAFAPEAKIIAMVREPVSFLRSLHSQYTYYLDETCSSLLQAVELEPARRLGRHLPPSVRLPSLLYYSEMARFSEQIGRYTALFPKGRVKVVVMDDLAERTAEVYREILDFLGVDSGVPIPPAASRKVNPNKETRSRFVQARLRDWRLALRGTLPRDGFPAGPDMQRKAWTRLLPAALQARLVERLTRLNTRWAPLPPLDDGERRALMAKLAPEVVRLGDRLGRDLVALWGYGPFVASRGAPCQA